MSIGELLSLKARIWKEQVFAFKRYAAQDIRFAICDLSLGVWGLFSNPYRVCRKFLQKKGEEQIYAYGETPLTTLEKIVTECRLCSADHWLELGSGRGKGCFWVGRFIGCRVTGVEWIPQFVQQSRLLARLHRFRNVNFLCKDFAEAPFSQATAVYLYGTCLSQGVLKTLLKKMIALPPGAKVITISEPLASSSFRLEKTFSVCYPWGRTNAYLHIKKG